MLTTLLPSQEAARVVQDLTACPSRCTTQAPHWLVSQPTCVPVSRSCSRRNCTNSVLASTCALTALPFTVMLTLTMRPPVAAVVEAVAAGAAAAGLATPAGGEAGSAGFFPLRNRENMTSSSLAPRLGRTLTVSCLFSFRNYATAQPFAQSRRVVPQLTRRFVASASAAGQSRVPLEPSKTCRTRPVESVCCPGEHRRRRFTGRRRGTRG